MDNIQKRIFLSHPMSGKTLEEVKKDREKYIKQIIEKTNDNTIFVHDNIQEDLPEGTRPIVYIANDIKMLTETDAVYFAPGWENSRGCKVEHMVAKEYGIPCYYL